MSIVPDYANPPPQPHRRWFRYSLRTLWIFITLLAIGLAWVAHERSQSRYEHQIAERLKASGATVEFAGLYDDPLLDVQSWWCNSLNALLGTRVRRIEAVYTFIDLSPFAALQNLQELQLTITNVSDLSPIAGLKKLKHLSVDSSPVSDLSPLAGLEALEYLSLSNTAVSELSPLAGLKNLRVLDLEATPVRDLKPLTALMNLQELHLSNTQLTDLSPLAGLKNLSQLWLYATEVDDEQVKMLKQALPEDCDILQ